MAQARGWRRLAALHHRIEDQIERALQAEHDLNVNEFCVLHLLSQQDDKHLRMQELADAVVLSQSAITRLVTRLENRGLLRRYLCPDDRRGVYTDVTEAGRNLLAQAQPTHDAALAEALEVAERREDLSELAGTLKKLV